VRNSRKLCSRFAAATRGRFAQDRETVHNFARQGNQALAPGEGGDGRDAKFGGHRHPVALALQEAPQNSLGLPKAVRARHVEMRDAFGKSGFEQRHRSGRIVK
jgi:hypothetical protein